MKKKHKKPYRIKAYFIEGLMVLVPTVLSAFVVIFLFDFFAYPLHFLLSYFPFHHHLVRFLSLLFTLFTLFFLGYLAQSWIQQETIKSIHRLFVKIPIIGSVYRSCHDVVTTLLGENPATTSKVVTFPFGNTNGYVVGIMPRSENTFEGHVPIIHTGPSPIHSLILIPSEKILTPTSLTVPQAFRWSLAMGSISLNKEELDKV